VTAQDSSTLSTLRCVHATVLARITAVPLSIDLTHPKRSKLFHREHRISEEKYDGWRLAAVKDGRNVRLISRRGRDHTPRFPDIAAVVASLSPRTLILSTLF
jgi:ATP-dependent DNA ligase